MVYLPWSGMWRRHVLAFADFGHDPKSGDSAGPDNAQQNPGELGLAIVDPAMRPAYGRTSSRLTATAAMPNSKRKRSAARWRLRPVSAASTNSHPLKTAGAGLRRRRERPADIILHLVK